MHLKCCKTGYEIYSLFSAALYIIDSCYAKVSDKKYIIKKPDLFVPTIPL